MERKAVCKIDDVPVNELREFEVSPGRKICIVNAGDRMFACQAVDADRKLTRLEG